MPQLVSLLAYAVVLTSLPLLFLLAYRGPVDGEGDTTPGWWGEKTANVSHCQEGIVKRMCSTFPVISWSVSTSLSVCSRVLLVDYFVPRAFDLLSSSDPHLFEFLFILIRRLIGVSVITNSPRTLPSLATRCRPWPSYATVSMASCGTGQAQRHGTFGLTQSSSWSGSAQLSSTAHYVASFSCLMSCL